ncbi:hypothetical protein L3Q82_016660, partial [Scortum barcoo]
GPAGQTAAPEDTGLVQWCPPDRGQEESGVHGSRRRGKRGGLLARLKANAGRPPIIPSLFLSNVRSLDNKLDLLRLRLGVSREMRNITVLCLMETWLNDNMPDPAFQIDSRLLFRVQTATSSRGKPSGGGLCVYVNKGWCTNCTLVNSHWSTIHRLSSATSASAQRTSPAPGRSGDRLALRAARRQLTAGVKRAKAAYAQRIQGHFTSNDPRSMWRGIKCITDYNTRDAQCPRDPSLPDASQQLLRPLWMIRTPPPAPDSPPHQEKSPSV